MERLLRDCLDGKRLSRDEALLLSSVQGEELAALLETAAALRDRHKGRTITFSPKVFLPLTNLCRDFCGYCTFRRAPDEPGAHTMTLDEVVQIARRGRLMGCTEALFSLGDKPEAIYPEMRSWLGRGGYTRMLEYLYDASAAVLEETGLLPHSNPGLMGKKDLTRLKEVNISLGLMLESVSDLLLLYGGPHFNAPDKKPALRLKTIEKAGKLSIPFTTGILVGIGESRQERVESLFAIRELNERHGHIQEVIIQNFRAKPATPMQDQPGPRPDEMLKTIALARLILGGEMNIQAPPNLTPHGYEAYLDAGINDWGGISPLTLDHINPEAPWPELGKLAQKTAAAGFILKARLPIYPEFLARGEPWVPRSLLPYIEGLCGHDNLVKGALHDPLGFAL